MGEVSLMRPSAALLPICDDAPLLLAPTSQVLDVENIPRPCVPSSHLLELLWGALLGEPPNAPCRKGGWGAAELPPELRKGHVRVKSWAASACPGAEPWNVRLWSRG